MNATPDAPEQPADSPVQTRLQRSWTIPNVLSVIRLVGSPFMVVLAFYQQPYWFVGCFVVLAMTDWIDGKLAILLEQRSTIGARLDSWADATLYLALLIGSLVLKWDALREELLWILPVGLSYIATTVAGFWKFGRWPSYHTRAAKMSWGLVTVGAVSMLAGWARWPFRLAMVGVTWTNLEAILITLTLSTSRTDVLSWWQAKRLQVGQVADKP